MSEVLGSNVAVGGATKNQALRGNACRQRYSSLHCNGRLERVHIGIGYEFSTWTEDLIFRGADARYYVFNEDRCC
ncbi:hypothetical protein HYPDE_27973 [Hyphomicrobium denitrificans 1NES1]|uniref:Uncharacterized protein n=1 Tax=Hyphomicrobium denitrificans 1NES1 TaxID=670307 RepID=N0B1B1_9HYPH|nr:hypothetical protein HYPDE_27973 [Hyphomicrobium denitrificans 1NES1]